VFLTYVLNIYNRVMVIVVSEVRDTSGSEGLKKACNTNVENEIIEFLEVFLISWHYLSPNDA